MDYASTPTMLFFLVMRGSSGDQLAPLNLSTEKGAVLLPADVYFFEGDV